MVPTADGMAGSKALAPTRLDPLGQTTELRHPALGAAVHDGSRRRQALAHRRPAVVGQAQGADQLVVELVVAEPFEMDGAADDIGVFEGHAALLGPAAQPVLVYRQSLCPTGA